MGCIKAKVGWTWGNVLFIMGARLLLSTSRLALQGIEDIANAIVPLRSMTLLV